MFEEIRQQFDEVIQYSQDFDKVSSGPLFDQWLEAKRDIIEAFDGKLIYEVPEPVHFHLDPVDRDKHFDNFIYNIHNVYHNHDLVDFLSQNKLGFFTNTVCSAYEKNDIKIPQGMKLVKAFKYFEKDKNLLEQLQIQASQVIQEDKIEGTLCFSVHPLDFLSASENTYNWRSCHALDGEYRAGNLSYMVDKSTIICYLKGADNDSLPSFPYSVPWNSKKWRVLIYLSKNWDMIFAGRQYPFASMGGLNIVYEHLLKALKLTSAHFSGWKNDYLESFTTKNGDTCNLTAQYMPIRGRLYEFFDIVEDGENALQFNDLLRSSTYHDPYYAIKDNCYWWAIADEVPKVTVGGSVPCLYCGENTIKDPDMMVCRHCADTYGFYPAEEDYPICDSCGVHIRNDDWYEVQGEIICNHCYQTECFTCASCGRVCFNDDKHYDRDTEEYLCFECYEDRKEGER